MKTNPIAISPNNRYLILNSYGNIYSSSNETGFETVAVELKRHVAKDSHIPSILSK
jgi:hypothetical protein